MITLKQTFVNSGELSVSIHLPPETIREATSLLPLVVQSVIARKDLLRQAG